MIDKDYIKGAFEIRYEPVKLAKIQLSEALISLDAPLSKIIETWIKIADNGIFEKVLWHIN